IPADAVRWGRGRERLAWSVAAAFLVAALASITAFVLGYLRTAVREDVELRFSILPPDGTSFGTVILSPDGRQLAFTVATRDGPSQVWVRPLRSLIPQALSGTEGAAFPFWSP